MNYLAHCCESCRAKRGSRGGTHTRNHIDTTQVAFFVVNYTWHRIKHQALLGLGFVSSCLVGLRLRVNPIVAALMAAIPWQIIIRRELVRLRREIVDRISAVGCRVMPVDPNKVDIKYQCRLIIREFSKAYSSWNHFPITSLSISCMSNGQLI